MPELPVDSWWFCGIVLILLMFAIWLIARLTASATEESDPAAIHREMLTAVSELHSRGELTPDEYRSIKSRLVEQLSGDSPSNDSDDSSHEEQPEKENKGEHNPGTETPEESTSPDNAESDDGSGLPPDREQEKKDQNQQEQGFDN